MTERAIKWRKWGIVMIIYVVRLVLISGALSNVANLGNLCTRSQGCSDLEEDRLGITLKHIHAYLSQVHMIKNTVSLS